MNIEPAEVTVTEVMPALERETEEEMEVHHVQRSPEPTAPLDSRAPTPFGRQFEGMFSPPRPRAPTKFTGDDETIDFASFLFALQCYLAFTYTEEVLASRGVFPIVEHLSGKSLTWWRATCQNGICHSALYGSRRETI
eukprot:Nk52_evm39s266 gene=Nk52_evmTU39s266